METLFGNPKLSDFYEKKLMLTNNTPLKLCSKHNALSGILAFFYKSKFGEGSFGHEKYVQKRFPQNRIEKKGKNAFTYINVRGKDFKR